MKALVNTIIQKKLPCYFVSPHLDDAILSCGGLITHLADKTSISVLTVFTEADDAIHTLSARAFLKQCGVPDATELFSKRRDEDKHILESLGVAWDHFGFVDALWRKRKMSALMKRIGTLVPEYAHVYPTYRFHITSGKVSKADSSLVETVSDRIAAIIGSEQQAMIFFPIGLGKHVDHILTHKVGLHFPKDVIFYSDFPYCLSDRVGEDILREKGFIKGEFDEHLEEKNALIKRYATQPLFAGDPPIIPETYFVPKNLLAKM